jgi:hypothetical protein
MRATPLVTFRVTNSNPRRCEADLLDQLCILRLVDEVRPHEIWPERQSIEQVLDAPEVLRLARRIVSTTSYPFDNSSSARYHPSWPVIPVIMARLDT